ncbi:MAG: HlyD family secretion protein [Gammaproteobacteria bacterium]|nr:HlyD family secretion protein [Gammaproteobacteria bacterium]MCW5582844.1 HlyD family secretion protein [Gammaproteobacteria bacterium]
MTFLKYTTGSKIFKQIVIFIFFALSSVIWLGYWIYGHYYLSTDDAYINANVVQIAPRITGKVITLYIDNNQYVKKGQPLFDIDPKPFQLAIHLAQAQLALSIAELEHAALTKDRTSPLVAKKFLSPQDGDNAIASYKTAIAKVDQAKANLAQAYLNMEYTKIRAPSNGWVTNVTLSTGDIIPTNQPLFALICDGTFWVDANFKETELEAIQPGQFATIVTDLYPNYKFKGVVESISGGTGAVFSLLPPQNATGNWVKVTQRVPVRIRILNPDTKHPLRIGISATVTVSIHNNSTQPKAQ